MPELALCAAFSAIAEYLFIIYHYAEFIGVKASLAMSSNMHDADIHS